MGFIRLFLALAVVATHTSTPYPIAGREAVVLFYTISGFYMALILNKKYVGPGSVWRFYKSRYIKLWVPFALITCCYLVAAYLTHRPTLLGRIGGFPLWLSMAAFLSNCLIFGQDLVYLFSFDSQYHLTYLPYGNSGWNGAQLSVNSVIFSVSLELYFYLLAPFVLRSFTRVVIFTLIGFLWHAWLTLGDYNRLDLSYHLFPSTFLFFGLGASAYWISRTDKSVQHQLGKMAIFMILMVLPWTRLMTEGVILVLFFFAIPVVFDLSKNLSIDRLVGELSYPVYLVHIPLITLFQFKSNEFVYTVCWSIFFAALLYLVVEKPLNKYRERFAKVQPLNHTERTPA